MRSATTIGLAAVLLGISCGAPGYDFVWHGENVTVYGYGVRESDACGGSFTEIDGHTRMIMDDLGVGHTPPSVFLWLSSDYWDQLEQDPCRGNVACTRGGVAVARMLPQMHEVTHSITAWIGRDGCPRLLDEGLANYYDAPTPTIELDLHPSPTIRELMEDGFVTTPEAYTRGAHFVSYLVENYGAPSIVQLCRALPDRPTMAQWGNAVSNVLGVGLEQLLVSYDEYPHCNYEQMRARLWGCSGPPDFTFSAIGDEYVVEAGCEDPQTTNAAWPDGDAMLQRRVYLAEDMRLRISSNSLRSDADGAIHIIQQCAPCSENPDVFVEITDDPYDHEHQTYRAGMHEVSVVFDKRDSVRLTLEAVE